MDNNQINFGDVSFHMNVTRTVNLHNPGQVTALWKIISPLGAEIGGGTKLAINKT